MTSDLLHLDAAFKTFQCALGDLLTNGAIDFVSLFAVNGVLSVPFDAGGNATQVSGREAIRTLAESLAGRVFLEDFELLSAYRDL